MHFSFYDKSDRPHTSVTFLAKKALLTPLQISLLFSLCCAYCLLMHRCVLFFPSKSLSQIRTGRVNLLDELIFDLLIYPDSITSTARVTVAR